MLRPRGANGVDDFKGEADAVVERAAVFVGAVIGERREELVEKIAVGSVDFNEIETGGVRATCGGDEIGDDLLHAGTVEGGGDGVGFVEADGGGS